MTLKMTSLVHLPDTPASEDRVIGNRLTALRARSTWSHLKKRQPNICGINLSSNTINCISTNKGVAGSIKEQDACEIKEEDSGPPPALKRRMKPKMTSRVHLPETSSSKDRFIGNRLAAVRARSTWSHLTKRQPNNGINMSLNKVNSISTNKGVAGSIKKQDACEKKDGDSGPPPPSPVLKRRKLQDSNATVPKEKTLSTETSESSSIPSNPTQKGDSSRVSTRKGSGKTDSYPIGTKLKVKHQTGLIYDATVIESSRLVGRIIEYKVHYSGWNKRFDEWIPTSLILANSVRPAKSASSTNSAKPTDSAVLTDSVEPSESTLSTDSTKPAESKVKQREGSADSSASGSQKVPPDNQIVMNFSDYVPNKRILKRKSSDMESSAKKTCQNKFSLSRVSSTNRHALVQKKSPLTAGENSKQTTTICSVMMYKIKEARNVPSRRSSKRVEDRESRKSDSPVDDIMTASSKSSEDCDGEKSAYGDINFVAMSSASDADCSRKLTEEGFDRSCEESGDNVCKNEEMCSEEGKDDEANVASSVVDNNSEEPKLLESGQDGESSSPAVDKIEKDGSVNSECALDEQFCMSNDGETFSTAEVFSLDLTQEKNEDVDDMSSHNVTQSEKLDDFDQPDSMDGDILSSSSLGSSQSIEKLESLSCELSEITASSSTPTRASCFTDFRFSDLTGSENLDADGRIHFITNRISLLRSTYAEVRTTLIRLDRKNRRRERKQKHQQKMYSSQGNGASQCSNSPC